MLSVGLAQDIAFLHAPTRTLIEADLLLNLPPKEQVSTHVSSLQREMLIRAMPDRPIIPIDPHTVRALDEAVFAPVPVAAHATRHAPPPTFHLQSREQGQGRYEGGGGKGCGVGLWCVLLFGPAYVSGGSSEKRETRSRCSLIRTSCER